MKESHGSVKLTTHTIFFRLSVFAVLGLGAFFRFYNFINRYSLGDENIRDALIGFQGARDWQLPITGPFSSAGPFVFGPWYWYHLIFSVFISHSMYAPWILLAATSVAFIFVMYKIGELIHGKTFGLIVAYLVAISPPQIIGALHLINPNLVHIYAGLTVYLFIKIIADKLSARWSVLLGLCLGIAINNHYGALNLGIVAIVLLFFVRRPFSHALATFGGVAITMVPLLFFNLMNHWYLVRNLWYYTIHGKELIYVANSWTLYVTKFWPMLWSDIIGVPVVVGVSLTVGAVIAIVFDILKNKNTHILRLTVSFLTVFIVLRYYWGERFYGYFNFLHPFVFVFSALPLYLLGKHRIGRWVSLALLIGLSVFILPLSFQELKTRFSNTAMPALTNQIKNSLPNANIMLYNCKNRQSTRDSSVVFLLTTYRQSGGANKKVGFLDESCSYPGYKAPLNPDGVTYAPFVEPNSGLRAIGMVDLSEASAAGLLKADWIEMSAKTIYNANVRWWFTEQP